MIALIPFPEISPTLFSVELWGRTFAIHWYAIAYIVGFILAWAWARRLVSMPQIWRDSKAPMNKAQVEDLLTWMVLGTIIGGRIGYVLFYSPEILLQDPLRVFYVWEGGMSFHGGFAGVILAGILFCKRNGLNIWSAGDVIASSACFGLFLGRIANFINAELWGRPTDVPWAVAFPGKAAQDCGYLTPEICGRHPSQLYEAGLEGVVLFAIILFVIFRRDWLKTPGMMIGLFFLGYGLARVFVENFRQADAQFISPDNPYGFVIGFSEWGLTMGQVLSLPMVFIGIALLALVQRRR